MSRRLIVHVAQYLIRISFSQAGHILIISVPARHIYEGAAPCPYWLAPCLIYKCPARIIFFFKLLFFHLQNVIAVVFSHSRCKNACL